MKVDHKHPAVKLLQAFYPSDCKGFINLRFIAPKGEVSQVFVRPQEVEAKLSGILERHKDKDAYFQVAMCDGKGGKTHITEMPGLYVDIDFREDFGIEEVSKLPGIPLKASIIVSSGGGLHLYWLLREPTSNDDIPLVENILRCLALVFHGDSACAEAARILRIPGTLNYKYDPPREVKLIRFEPDQRYNLNEFDDVLPPLERANKTGGQRNPPGWERPIVEEGVTEGERNTAITKLAGRYLAKGLARGEILPILLDANSRFSPPLDEDEVKRVLDSVFKTNERNHPSREEGERERRKTNLQLTTLEDVFEYPEPSYLIESLLIENTVNILGAYTGAGKSMTALSIIRSVLAGEPLWGKFSTNLKGAVLLIDEETPDSFLRDRVEKMGFCCDWPLHFLHFQGVRLDDDVLFGEVMEKIQEIQPVLVVIDSLIRIHRQREDDATAMALVVERLRKIANLGTTVLVIHHHRKAEGPLSQKLRGSSDIPGGVDIEYALVPKDDVLVLSSVKTRTKPFGPVRLKLDVTDEAIEMRYLGTEGEEILSVVKDILGDRTMDLEEMAKALKEESDFTVGTNSLRRALKEAVAEGKIEGKRVGRGGKWVFSEVSRSAHIYRAVERESSGNSGGTFMETPPKQEEGREAITIDSQGEAEVSRGKKTGIVKVSEDAENLREIEI